MTSKAMRRAERSSRAVRRGREMLDLIASAPCRKRLVEAAKAGVPPVSAISRDLLRLVGGGHAKLQPVKSFVGLCVRAVLEDEGFQVNETGVRLSNDPVFRTGSVYVPKSKMPVATDFWERLVRMLTDDEVQRLEALLKGRRRA